MNEKIVHDRPSVDKRGRRWAGLAVGAVLPMLVSGQADAEQAPNVYIMSAGNGYELQYVARDGYGDVNRVIVEDRYETALSYTIEDVHPLRPGYGCTSLTPKKVICQGPVSPITAVKIVLQDGDDHAEVRMWIPTDSPSKVSMKIHGGKGTDTLVGGPEKTSLFGDEGNDNLFGFGGDDDLHGGMGNDVIYGLEDNDAIEGNDGWDRLWGGVGADVLHGAGITGSSSTDVQNELDGGDGGALGDDGYPMSTDHCLTQGTYGTVIRCEVSFGS